jgi:hypothetical protein
MENVDSKEQITQTIQTFVNTGVQAVKPDITIEDFPTCRYFKSKF